MQKIYLIVISLVMFSGVCFAEEPIKAEVDKTKIATDETIIYKISIISSDKKVPAPQLPDFEGFSVLSRVQSSSISFSSEGVRTSMIYTFILAPLDAGKFSIGPATVKAGNKIYSSETLEIEVTPSKSMPKKESRPPFPAPKKGLPPGDRDREEMQTTL